MSFYLLHADIWLSTQSTCFSYVSSFSKTFLVGARTLTMAMQQLLQFFEFRVDDNDEKSEAGTTRQELKRLDKLQIFKNS